MKDPDGDGISIWRAAHVPAGTWEYKVALNESWDVSYPATNRVEGATQLAYIIHRGDEKDPGPDQFLIFAEHGYEIWQLQGADPERPFLIPRLP